MKDENLDSGKNKLKEKKGAPELRFEGFLDDWEIRKLREITKWSKGSNLAKVVINDKNVGEDVIHYADLYKFSPVVNEVIHWSDSGEGTIIPENSLLFPMSDVTPVGLARTSTITKSGVKAGSDILIGTISETSCAEFLSYQVNANYGKILPLVTGTTVRHISSSSLDTLDILIPKIGEQAKIGKFFSQLDSLITLHQHKLEKLKQLKQAYLKQLFPKNGDTVPELRFEGFADDWEQRKSKELCTISTGKGNTQDKVDDGTYPFYVRSATIEKSDEYLYDQEAVLTVGDGVGTGKVFHYVNGKYNLHQRVYRMYDFKDVSAKYFYYYFSKNFYKRVMSMTAKTSVDSVRMEMIADMNIVFPSVKEQEKIVELFSNLDKTIALHLRKLDKLKQLKQGYMQNMFI